MWSLFAKTGFVGWILLALSIVAVALIIWRLVHLVRYRAINRDHLAQGYQLISDGDLRNAYNHFSEHENSIFRKATALLLRNYEHPKPMRDELVSHLLQNSNVELYKGVRSLRLIGVISPMLGLLGTVLGMITAFKDIAGSTTPVNPAMLADGLWEAMLTTAFGLIIALPCLLFAHLFSRHAERAEHDIEHGLNMLSLGMEDVDVSL